MVKFFFYILEVIFLSCDSFFLGAKCLQECQPFKKKVLEGFLCVNANDGHFCWKSYIPGASICDLFIMSLFGHDSPLKGSELPG